MSTSFNNQTLNTVDPSQQMENSPIQDSSKSEGRMSTENYINTKIGSPPSMSGLSNNFKFSVQPNPFSTLKQDLKLNIPQKNLASRNNFIKSEPNYLPSQINDLKTQFALQQQLALQQLQQLQQQQVTRTQESTYTPVTFPPPLPVSTFQPPPQINKKRQMMRQSVDNFKPAIALAKFESRPDRDTSYDSDIPDTKDESSGGLLSNIAKNLNTKFGGMGGEVASISSIPITPSLHSSTSTFKKIKIPTSTAPSVTTSPLQLLPQQNRYLGSIGCEVIGSASFRGTLIAEEEIRVMRETKSINPHSIRIESIFLQPLGYLHENLSCWLAPLLDRQRIQVRGYLSPPIILGKDITIILKIFLPPGILNIADTEERHLWSKLADALNITLGDIFMPIKKTPPPQVFGSDISVVDLTDDVAMAMKRSGSFDNLDPTKKIKLESSDSSIPFFNPEQEELQVERLFNSLKSVKVLREMEPPKILRVQLRSYQKQALAWMVDRENTENERTPTTVPYPWEQYVTNDGKKYYYNKETKQTSWELPIQFSADKADLSVKGGILADEMGMGKTIEVLSLILTNRPEPAKKGQLKIEGVTTDKEENSEESSSPMEDSPASPPIADADKDIPSNGTLIVCPLSLMNQWVEEIKKHTDPSVSLSIYCYHGVNRNRDPAFLAKHDIVLTTFSTLAAEVPPEESKKLKRPPKNETPALLDVVWYRVVLDEAHTIKDRNTRTAKAAFVLKADRRWCVTGTPIQNKLDDIFSLLHFLHVQPYCEYAWWSKVIMRPIKNKDEKGFNRLQTILDAILLRRTKDQKIENGNPIVALPQKTINLKAVPFTKEEEEFYQALWNSSKNEFKEFVASGTLMENYAHVLELLLRLRQACDHPYLVTSKKDKRSGNSTELIMKILSENPSDSASRNELLCNNLDLSDEECPICLEAIDNPVMTSCAHFFCKSCITQHLNNEASNSSCPACRRVINVESLISVPKNGTISKEKEEKEKKTWRSSTKIDAMMNDLLSIEDLGIKTIIFSQWTSMLDLVEIPLKEKGLKFVRLDGSMNHQQRERAINIFKEDPEVRIFLISMKAGGLGLNLTVASNVYLLDPWWNPATEDQAIDRVHRLGQTRPVTVTRFVIQNSVEERILELQQHKKSLAQGALGMNNKEMRQVRIEELRQLFRD